MESHAHSTLLWGLVAILLVAALAAWLFCHATESLFQSDACDWILQRARRVAAWF
jgi:hypothetical protein